MQLPWNKKKEIEEEKKSLEAEISEKEEEIERLQNMLEAEKDRRSKLSREKQEAEEKINKLEDKIGNLEDKQRKIKEKQSEKTRDKFENVDFRQFKQTLDKLKTIRSDEEDLASIYSPGKLKTHSKISDIKNSIPENVISPLMDKQNILIFFDENLGLFCFQLNPFYEELFQIDNKFRVEKLTEFIDSEKHWVLVSRGDTTLFREHSGEVKKLDEFKDRVDRKHSKGGFSQGRFERKRDEQITKHVNNVKKEIKPLINLYVLGDKDLCKDLPGNHLSGFDPNQSELNSFYQARRLKR